MSYEYAQERDLLFTDDGQRKFMAVRDRVNGLLRQAGAVRMQEAIGGTSGSSWQAIACIDRMVELGELVELKRDCWDQYRVFTTPKAWEG